MPLQDSWPAAYLPISDGSDSTYSVLYRVVGRLCSVVRVSASYSTASHVNGHPQSLGPTEKFCLISHLSSGVSLFAYCVRRLAYVFKRLTLL